MLVSRRRTERPRDLYYSLVLVFAWTCVDLGGRRIIATKAVVESSLKYHSGSSGHLNLDP